MQIIRKIVDKIVQYSMGTLVASSIGYVASSEASTYFTNVYNETIITKTVEIFKPSQSIPPKDTIVITFHDTLKTTTIIPISDYLFAEADTLIQNRFDKIKIEYKKGKFNVVYQFTDSIISKHYPETFKDSIRFPIYNSNPNNQLLDTVLKTKNITQIKVLKYQ